MVAFGRIISMFCLFLNAKLIAVFAGSNGFGVYSLLINLADFMVCLFGLGIANSGIRQIARYRTDEQRGINNTFTVICASVAFCMLLCVILFCLLCREISSFVFATPEHYWSIMLILGYICGKMWSELNIAILNGLQKLRELTLGQIIGAAASSSSDLVHSGRNPGKSNCFMPFYHWDFVWMRHFLLCLQAEKTSFDPL